MPEVSAVPELKTRPELVFYVDNNPDYPHYEIHARCELIVPQGDPRGLMGLINAKRFDQALDAARWYLPANPGRYLERVLELGFTGQSDVLPPGVICILGKIKPNLVMVTDSEWNYSKFRVQCEVAFDDFDSFHAMQMRILGPNPDIDGAKRDVIRLAASHCGLGSLQEIVGLTFEAL